MLKIFGDSFSNYHLPENKNLHWYSLLSNKVNLPFNNFADGGCTNKEILFSLIYNIQDFKENDIIVCNLTHPKRMSLSPGSSEVIFENEVLLDGKQCFDIKTKTKKFIDEPEWSTIKNYFNKFFIPNETKSPGYIDEIKHLLKHTASSVKTVIVWNWLKIYEKKEFNLSDNDKHFNIAGHQFVCDTFYNKFLNKRFSLKNDKSNLFFEDFS